MTHFSKLSFYCLFFLSIFAAQQSKASHAAGAELTYEHLQDSTWRFYFKFYRDCSGIGEPQTQTMCFYNSCTSFVGGAVMQKMGTLPGGGLNGQPVLTLCPGIFTTCDGGTLPGYREWWYSADVTLPSRCDFWTFYTGVSARNSSTNLAGQGIMYIETTLNNFDVSNNNSPYFSVKPVPFVCINVPYTYNNGGVDPDSDSTSYEFIQPRQGPAYLQTNQCVANPAVSPCPWFSSTYSLTNPLDCANTFTFNATTGQLNFTPTGIGTYTVTVRCSDYRNGKKIGSVLRDVQISTLQCNVPQPNFVIDQLTISGGIYNANAIPPRIESCANQPLSFSFGSTSSDPIAILVATDNHDDVAPGSTVTYTGQATNNVQGTFSWTPGMTDTGLKVFAVTIKDSTCVGPGIIISQTFIIPIYIRPAVLTVRDETVCIGSTVQLLASGTGAATWDVAPGGSDIGTLSCTTCNDPVAKPDITSTYFAVSLNANGCSNIDSVKVIVDNTNRINIEQGDTIVVCRPDVIQLKTSVTGPRPLQNLSCGPIPSFPTNPVDTAEIVPSFKQIKGDPILPPSPASFYMGQYSTARHQYLIKASDMKRGGQYSGTLRSIGFKLLFNSGGGALRNVKISLKCTDKTELSTANGFENYTIPVYNNAALQTLPAGSGFVYFPFTTPYNWDTTQNLIVDFCYSNPSAQTQIGSFYTNSGYNGNLHAFNNSGNLCASGAMPNLAISDEIPLMNFVFHPAPETDFAYNWDNGVFLPNAYTDTPRVYASRSQPLYVSTRNRNGCIIRDTLNVYMPTSAIRPLDTNICLGHGAFHLALNGQTYQWYEYDGLYYPSNDLSGNLLPTTELNCSDCPNPTAFPTSDQVYAVVIQDHGCLDTFKTKVDVTPFPTTRILNDDTAIWHGGSVKLVATGADRYLWTPFKWMSANTQVFNPVVSPEEPTTYVVMGSAARNLSCRTYDSIAINVKYIWPIFVPSGFSPNGDGRNDMFRVTNLTTQKIEEFRVYSRYGREVFSGRDNTGWDGTVDGKAADLGAYHYIIRISYADGKSKLFKGDVELIR